MTKIIMCGCNGKMGQTITQMVADNPACEIVAGIDREDLGLTKYPVFKSLKDVNVEADVVVDFSAPVVLKDLLANAEEKKVGLVLCTTGYTDEDVQMINAATERIAILRSANMSLGINLLLKLVKEATEVLVKADFDPEIVEKHHRLKVDAPSGTALALADSINEALAYEYDYRYERQSVREKRPKKEIGISAVRGGNIVGEHEVIFAGTDEIIEFKHTAYSKAVFAKGAVQAAIFLKGKSAGMYSMMDVVM